MCFHQTSPLSLLSLFSVYVTENDPARIWFCTVKLKTSNRETTRKKVYLRIFKFLCKLNISYTKPFGVQQPFLNGIYGMTVHMILLGWVSCHWEWNHHEWVCLVKLTKCYLDSRNYHKNQLWHLMYRADWPHETVKRYSAYSPPPSLFPYFVALQTGM